MKKMMKRISALALAIMMVFIMASCGSSDTSAEVLTYDDALEAAKGTTVTFYGWGGDDQLNAWLDDYFAPRLKEKYDITLERVPMGIEDILSQMTDEKDAGTEESDIDMIWINGENFKTSMENDFLYGPFLNELPNYGEYYDTEDTENNYDFSYPIDGYEAPYGKAQIVFEVDTAKTDMMPKNAEEFKEFVMANPGKVTYPALPDFTGSAFVRNIIYETCGGYEQFQDMEADKEVVKEAIQPAIDYLKELNPYLWNEGKTFPESSVKADEMFADGELIFRVTYDAYDIASYIDNGTFPETAQSFTFDNGTIGNTNYIAIAKNSGNAAGAMVAINEMMDPEVQANRYQTLKTVPVTDYEKLSDEQKAAFDDVDLGPGTIPQDELLAKRLPEMPSALVPIIEEIWEEEVPGK